MYVMKKETTIFPQTPKGHELAMAYIDRNKESGWYKSHKEDTVSIIVNTEYVMEVWEDAKDGID